MCFPKAFIVAQTFQLGTINHGRRRNLAPRAFSTNASSNLLPPSLNLYELIRAMCFLERQIRNSPDSHQKQLSGAYLDGQVQWLVLWLPLTNLGNGPRRKHEKAFQFIDSKGTRKLRRMLQKEAEDPHPDLTHEEILIFWDLLDRNESHEIRARASFIPFCVLASTLVNGWLNYFWPDGPFGIRAKKDKAKDGDEADSDIKLWAAEDADVESARQSSPSNDGCTTDTMAITSTTLSPFFRYFYALKYIIR